MEFFYLLVFWFFVFLVIYKKITKNVKIDEIDEKEIENKNYYLPYKVRKTLMSEHERLLFCNLRTLLGLKYDIYPQMKLDKIFCVEYQKAYKFYLGWLRRINQKSVDFLVVEKETQSPVFAIELDDSSHEAEDRIERDMFVQEIFKRNNFPLIRFGRGQYKVEELKIVLNKYL